MATTRALDRMTRAGEGGARSGAPADNIRLDWLMALTCCAIVFGLYIDGWAHNHGFVDDSFFTPWHALLYGAVAVAGLILIVSHFRNVGAGHSWRQALPRGYTLSLVGFFAFGAGGVFDLIWHETFGFEVGLEALISPAHLYLAFTGLLIMTGPIRALWGRESDGSWTSLAPAILCFTCITSVFTFFNAYAPIGGDMIDLTGRKPVDSNLLSVGGIAALVIQTNLLLGALLFMTRRWQLPFGAITLVFTLNSLLMTWYRVGESGEFILAVNAFIIGLASDLYYHRYGFSNVARLRLFACLMPFAYSVGVMLTVQILGETVWATGPLWWEIHMWLGAPALAGAFGYGLSMLLRPPAYPAMDAA